MTIWPLRFRAIDSDRRFFADDAGGYFVSSEAFLDRYARGALSESDQAFLRRNGQAFERSGDLAHTSFAWRWTARQSAQERLSYVILVPTLRCNLACTYCQVSRAAEGAQGYDWSDAILGDVLAFLDGLDTDEIKVEFQGGEPLLRIDLLDAVRRLLPAALCEGYVCRLHEPATLRPGRNRLLRQQRHIHQHIA